MATNVDGNTKTYLGLHVLISTKFGFSRQIFIKVPNVKFQGNLSSGNRADTCGQTDKQTHMKQIGAFRNYAKSA
jgi:hypothetical protein